MSKVDRTGGGRRWSDKALPSFMAAVLVLFLITAVVSGVVLKQNKDITSTQNRQDRILVAGCKRTQVIRDDLNVQAWVQYNVIQLAGEGPPPEKIADLISKLDPATRDLFVALLSGQAKAAPLYQHVLDSTQYSPPTDCDQASQNPAYQFLDPVPFKSVADCFDPTTERGRRPPVGCGS